jgi:polyisoprenoid-binding protein YceI
MTTTTDVTVPAGTWALDAVHSSVAFEIDYLGGAFKGSFREIGAELTTDGETARLSGVAQVASVDVKDETLSTHLQAPDFFDAEREPELRFSADGVALDGDTVEVQGEVTIKGVTRPVTVTGTVVPPVTGIRGEERVGLRVGATVDRTQFGVSWNAPLPGGGQALSDEVRIAAELYFVKG